MCRHHAALKGEANAILMQKAYLHIPVLYSASPDEQLVSQCRLACMA